MIAIMVSTNKNCVHKASTIILGDYHNTGIPITLPYYCNTCATVIHEYRKYRVLEVD
jgi:hypothetical protein